MYDTLYCQSSNYDTTNNYRYKRLQRISSLITYIMTCTLLGTVQISQFMFHNPYVQFIINLYQIQFKFHHSVQFHSSRFTVRNYYVFCLIQNACSMNLPTAFRVVSSEDISEQNISLSSVNKGMVLHTLYSSWRSELYLGHFVRK